MKKSTLLLGIAFFASIMASNLFAQTAPADAVTGDKKQGEVKTIFSFKNEIGLTDDQEGKLKVMLYDEQTLINTNTEKLKVLGKELAALIDKKESMPSIRAKLEEISKIQIEVSYLNIEDGRKIEAILTPAQLEKWKDIQKKFASQQSAQ